MGNTLAAEGSAVMEGTVINSGPVLGKGCIVNTPPPMDAAAGLWNLCMPRQGRILRGICFVWRGGVDVKAYNLNTIEVGDKVIIKGGLCGSML